MLAAGCGFLAAHFSSSFSTATALWASADASTPTETSLGRYFSWHSPSVPTADLLSDGTVPPSVFLDYVETKKLRHAFIDITRHSCMHNSILKQV